MRIPADARWTVAVKCRSSRHPKARVIATIELLDHAKVYPGQVWRSSDAELGLPVWKLEAIHPVGGDPMLRILGAASDTVQLDANDRPVVESPFDDSAAVRSLVRVTCRCGEDVPIRWEKLVRTAPRLADNGVESISTVDLRGILSIA